MVASQKNSSKHFTDLECFCRIRIVACRNLGADSYVVRFQAFKICTIRYELIEATKHLETK